MKINGFDLSKESFPDLLRNVRFIKGISLRECAEKLNISANNLHRLEYDENAPLPLTTVFKIFDVLDIDIFQILTLNNLKVRVFSLDWLFFNSDNLFFNDKKLDKDVFLSQLRTLGYNPLPPKEYNINFQEYLKNLRLSRHIDQLNLSYYANISNQAINRIEIGNPDRAESEDVFLMLDALYGDAADLFSTITPTLKFANLGSMVKFAKTILIGGKEISKSDVRKAAIYKVK